MIETKRLNSCCEVISIADGDHRARVIATRDALIKEHLELVEPIARRIRRKLPPSFDLDDLLQAGYVGLLHAATRYRPETFEGAPFAVYARHVIRGAILDSVKGKHYAECTRISLDDAPEASVDPRFEEVIDLARLRERIGQVDLTAKQRAVIDEYFSAELPAMSVVAERLRISKETAYFHKEQAVIRIRRAFLAA